MFNLKKYSLHIAHCITSFWTRGISIHLDGVGYEWKTNLYTSAMGTRTMGWRRPSQGLDINQTAKGEERGEEKCQHLRGYIVKQGSDNV